MTRGKRCACIVVLVAAALVGTGCETTGGGLYQWGNYEQNLFDYYHKPAMQETIVTNELSYLARLESQGKKPPPGLYAEAGTFLLLQGNTEQALGYYQKEHDTWPESQALMSNVIKNLQEQNDAKR